MITIELLTHPLAQRLTWTLAHFVWQGALIAVVLAVVVEMLRPRSANLRYGLSLFSLGLMLGIVPVTWFAAGSTQFAIGESGLESPVVATELPLVGAELQPTSASPSAAAGLQPTGAVAAWWTALQPILFCLWLAGCLLFSLRLLVGWVVTQALLRSREMLPAEVAAQLARVGHRLRMSIPRVVFASSQVSQALAVGFFKPVVLLPAAWLLELPPNLLEAIVAHELAHLRRCDLWVNLLQRVAEALLFYHPAIWWLSARLRRERELCCDELAVTATGARLEYAEALELTARWATVDGRPTLAAGFFGEGKMNLLHRVRSVLGISNERPASLWPASLLLGTLSLALLAAIYAASGTANADDEKPKEGAREGAREGAKDAPRGEVRREGDKPAASEADRFLGRTQAREGEPRREGDRPREGEVRRDGDRPRPEGAPRDGERRPDVRRPDAPREGAPRPDAPREGVRPATGEHAELLAIIKQLRAEVTELRAEVTRLRGGRPATGGGDLRIEPRREGADRPREGADRPREGADRPREGGDRPRTEGDRPRPDAERREGGDRPKVEGERREGADRPKEGDRK